jgi:hypothetical protein
MKDNRNGGRRKGALRDDLVIKLKQEEPVARYPDTIYFAQDSIPNAVTAYQPTTLAATISVITKQLGS